jgi:hypothetical protein
MQYPICQEKEKFPAISPIFFSFFIKKCKMEITLYSKKDQTCLSSMMPIQKNSRSTCFFCLPQQVPAVLSQENRGQNKTGS